ncbi:MAG: transcription termination factor Rho [candidate division WOR-3 bacterium]
MFDPKELEKKKLSELYEIARELNIENYEELRKKDLISKIIEHQAEQNGVKYCEGVLEIIEQEKEGERGRKSIFGFLRKKEKNYAPSDDDIYVSYSMIKTYGLREGDHVTGFAKKVKEGDKSMALTEIDKINGKSPEEIKNRPQFEDLTPFYPTRKFNLEIPNENDMSLRIVDLFVPIGMGQRGLIVSPPRAGKTILLQKIANAILKNHRDEVRLIVLLIDERPEEVTDFKRNVPADEIISSTFDMPAERHTKVSEIVLERAKRLVELGENVVILLDSLTRLARAYNVVTPHSGRTLSGGIDSTALVKPKKFFGAARNIEGGGSLTVIATALIETGSRMDEVIFEEFKGTGNMELVLDRKLADRRIFPAIDLNKSGTRREELLLKENVLKRIWVIRKFLSELDPIDAMVQLQNKMQVYNSNSEFIERVYDDFVEV